MEAIIGIVVGLLIGGLACWLIQGLRGKTRIAIAESKHSETVARLEGQLEQVDNAKQLVEIANQKFGETFQATAANALQSNNKAFLTLAEQNFGKNLESAKGEFKQQHEQFQALVKPLKENYEKLNPNIESLIQQEKLLAAETQKLSSALTDSSQVGSWGEVQLRRVVELAGMIEHCDFSEQTSVNGSRDRPDLTVMLPGQRKVVVDAKASTKAYLEAQQADDDAAVGEAMKRHAGALRKQVDDLAGKDYGAQVSGSLDFVVMFVPGDQFLAAALNANSDLIEYAMRKRVAITTPASLISLLWAVANGWQRYQIAESAEKVRQTGEDLYERLRVFVDHYEKIGKGLGSAVEAYNKSVGSYERRVVPAGRKFAELVGKDQDRLAPPPPTHNEIRTIHTDD